MSRKRKTCIYWRERGGERRAYADFRDFADAGGRREALAPPGESRATTDPVIAEKLVGDRLKELQEGRRNKVLLGVQNQAGLAWYADHHLVAKAKSGGVTDAWMEQTEYQLQAAVDFLGTERDLHSISVEDVQRFVGHLRERPNGRGGTLSDSSVRHYLNSLSNLYRRAASEGYVRPGYNPVAALMDKPTANRDEAKWLEVPDAALLLESARTYKPPADALPFMYPLLGVFLLSGGRKAEVMGLEVSDVSLERKTITFRPNKWRRLKTRNAHRSVPLWPQAEEIVREYFERPYAPSSGLLFPSTQSVSPRVVQDIRRSLDAIAKRVGWKAGEIRTKLFRHTFCAAALQLTDQGAAISTYTVARWMGHGGMSLVDRVYGHLGEIRHRSDVVEYRIEQHRERLKARLKLIA